MHVRNCQFSHKTLIILQITMFKFICVRLYLPLSTKDIDISYIHEPSTILKIKEISQLAMSFLVLQKQFFEGPCLPHLVYHKSLVMQMAELHSWISLYQVVRNDSLVQSLSQIVFLTNYRDPKSMLTLIFLLSKETQQNHNLFYSRIHRCMCSFSKVCDNSLKLRLIHQSKSQHLDLSLHQSRFYT